MTEQQAKALVVTFINSDFAFDGGPLVIIDSQTIEKSYGWIFFYDSQKHLFTGDFQDALAGNAPILVERDTGRLVPLGTALPVESYIAEYEAGRWGRLTPRAILEVTNLGPPNNSSGRWRIRGLAYEDIEVSDLVYADVGQGLTPLVVDSIQVKGRESPILRKGLDGDVYIVGKPSDDLSKVRYLLFGEKM